MALERRTQEVFVEKISGIVPANARTRSVDVSSAQPVRPGAPTWGRPEGKVTKAMALDPLDVQDRVDLRTQVTTADKAVAQGTQSYKKAIENARAKVVDDLSKKFFGTNPKLDVREKDTTKSEETLEGIEDLELSTKAQSKIASASDNGFKMPSIKPE